VRKIPTLFVRDWDGDPRSAFARWHAEAVSQAQGDNGYGAWPAGTFGPKINGNPEGFETHFLLLHAFADRLDAPRDFGILAGWLHAQPYEGVVWHHLDGRMAKIKKRDFPKP
jgi:hypothetical protein